MQSLLSERNMGTGDIERAYREAAGTWTGCDWPTEFGKTGLNLNGLKASQAELMARATAGQESADWRAAVKWMGQVENDSRLAEEMARKALRLALDRKLVGALYHVQSACTIEAKYHNRPVWQPLREAIELALPATDWEGF